jgi:acyl-CoA reductase-like NAD-dependent aldehyde dehydrogenase
MQRDQVSDVVERVLSRLRAGEEPPASRVAGPPAQPHGVFPQVAAASAAARDAQQVLAALPLEKRREIVANMRRRLLEVVPALARLAVEETKMGRIEDKIRKNVLAIQRTPGPEILEPVAWTGDDGLTLVERAPWGVIGSITPTTNPTETIICNGIGMVAGANAVVFNPHPLAKGVSAFTVDVMNRAAMEVGGPDNLFACLAEPTIQTAQELMKVPGVDLLVVTGGPEVVRVAMNSGKKVVAAGPGNPPVVVDETADLALAARGIVAGASMDNNLICIDEKEVFVVERVADALLEALAFAGAVQVRGHAITRLAKLVVTPDGRHPVRAWVGVDAARILEAIDLPFRGDPRLIVAEVPFDHPFVQAELLLPVVGLVRCRDVNEAIDLAVEAEQGNRHTAGMYSRNLDALHRMARACDCSIFVKNAPHYAGLGFGGEGYASFTIASPTGEGVTNARHFTRERRCTLAGYFRIV